MKYFNFETINSAIAAIRDGSNTNEHITSRAVSGITSFYYRVENKFITTPEQIQTVSRKRPDYVIEKHIEDPPYFLPHCFVEVKSLVNSDISAILDQVYDTILYKMDEVGGMSDNFSAFVIAVKGTKIAFYTYHNFISLLDEHNVYNYKGFIPLNYRIPWTVYRSINYNETLQDYDIYVRKAKGFKTEVENLSSMGAIGTNDLRHPHVLDLLNESHKGDIHSLFMHIKDYSADIFI